MSFEITPNNLDQAQAKAFAKRMIDMLNSGAFGTVSLC